MAFTRRSSYLTRLYSMRLLTVVMRGSEDGMSTTSPARAYVLGERVRIRNVIWTRYAEQTGQIVGINTKRQPLTLHKYTVLFENKHQEDFWHIQLERIVAS